MEKKQIQCRKMQELSKCKVMLEVGGRREEGGGRRKEEGGRRKKRGGRRKRQGGKENGEN